MITNLITNLINSYKNEILQSKSHIGGIFSVNAVEANRTVVLKNREVVSSIKNDNTDNKCIRTLIWCDIRDYMTEQQIRKQILHHYWKLHETIHALLVKQYTHIFSN